MANTQMPNMPGATVMTDTLDFVKSLWGSMGVPGLTAPTLSVEELDKKINDLKAVESWMNLNMSMLRGSIQALEVQRGTIATLKSVGASLAAAVNQGTAQGTGQGSAQGGEKSIFDNPYASAFFHHAREAEQQATPAPTPAPAPQANAAADAAAQMANPSIWWNMLQDQFKQAVSTAMVSESMMTDAAVKFAAAAAQPVAQPTAASEPAPQKEAAKPAPAKPAKAGKPSADK
jgi:hypothetical protein